MTERTKAAETSFHQRVSGPSLRDTVQNLSIQRPGGRPRTCWRDYMSHLARGHLLRRSWRALLRRGMSGFPAAPVASATSG